MINFSGEYLKYKLDKTTIVFTTKENHRNYNKNTKEGLENLERLKIDFNLENIIYLNQIHSDRILTYDKSRELNNIDGDGIITDISRVAIGVFTADCVPVIIVDEEKKVIGAIHSGWRGTINNIVGKAIQNMVDNYGCDPTYIKVFIGPHNRSCCYEVSEELISEFQNNNIFKTDKLISVDRNLNLYRCIELQLLDKGIKNINIVNCDLCTYCSKDIGFYSYRKEKDKEGRMYSFVFID